MNISFYRSTSEALSAASIHCRGIWEISTLGATVQHTLCHYPHRASSLSELEWPWCITGLVTPLEFLTSTEKSLSDSTQFFKIMIFSYEYVSTKHLTLQFGAPRGAQQVWDCASELR